MSAALVPFAGGERDPRRPNRARVDPEAVLACLRDGRTLTETGVIVGLTKERVRQIAKKYGVETVLSWAAVRKRQQSARAEKMEKKARRKAEINAALEPLVDAVRHGVSIREAAGHDEALVSKLNRRCREIGVVSQARTRHNRDFEERHILIERGFGIGATWADIAAAVSKAEGFAITVSAMHQWASRRGIYRIRPGRASPAPRIARAPRAKLAQPACQTFKRSHDRQTIDSIVALHGVKTAREIGFEFGLSRNAVIGIWNRHRPREAA